MPWDPVRDLLTMQERLENLFGEATPGWIPAADLYETADRFILTVENLAGLQPLLAGDAGEDRGRTSRVHFLKTGNLLEYARIQCRCVVVWANHLLLV